MVGLACGGGGYLWPYFDSAAFNQFPESFQGKALCHVSKLWAWVGSLGTKSRSRGIFLDIGTWRRARSRLRSTKVKDDTGKWVGNRIEDITEDSGDDIGGG